jgi:hypothetical protein
MTVTSRPVDVAVASSAADVTALLSSGVPTPGACS